MEDSFSGTPPSLTDESPGEARPKRRKNVDRHVLDIDPARAGPWLDQSLDNYFPTLETEIKRAVRSTETTELLVVTRWMELYVAAVENDKPCADTFVWELFELVTGADQCALVTMAAMQWRVVSWYNRRPRPSPEHMLKTLANLERGGTSAEAALGTPIPSALGRHGDMQRLIPHLISLIYMSSKDVRGPARLPFDGLFKKGDSGTGFELFRKMGTTEEKMAKTFPAPTMVEIGFGTTHYQRPGYKFLRDLGIPKARINAVFTKPVTFTGYTLLSRMGITEKQIRDAFSIPGDVLDGFGGGDGGPADVFVGH